MDAAGTRCAMEWIGSLPRTSWARGAWSHPEAAVRAFVLPSLPSSAQPKRVGVLVTSDDSTFPPAMAV